MSESFDPYYTWLGIPPAQQPPNHYRLLGVEAFEDNPDVIQRAADRCMSDLRTYQAGKHSADSQQLLNEVAAAKICLLDPKKKADYDSFLRAKLETHQGDAVAADVFASLPETAPRPSSVSTKGPGRSKPTPALIAASAVTVLVLIAAWIFLSNILLSNKKPSDEPQSVAKTDTPPKQAAADPPPPPPPPDTAPATVGQAASLPVLQNIQEKPETSSPPTPDAPSAASPPATASAPAPPPPSDPIPEAREEIKKHPIPSAEIQREIGAAIEETYKTSQAKTSEAKVQLAKELSAAAGKSAKPEEQYVLLRKAIDLACDGGDAALMLETIGPMTDASAIDPLAAKAAMLERFAKGPRSAARVQSLAESSRGVIEEALVEDRYEIASNLARTVADACSRSTPPLRKEAADRRKRVGQLQKQFEEVQKALQTLQAAPEDAEANLAAGTWYAFVKDDWKTGLPYLAKGSDPLLKSLANRELSSPPATPEDQLKLADAWWDAAAERRGEKQTAMLRTAGHWYEQAIGQLQGINKTKAEKRLSQIAELAQDSPSRPGREPPPAIAPFDAKRARGYQLQWARYLKMPVEFTNSIGMKFVLIPPGEFDMGTKEEAVERLRSEAQQRKDNFHFNLLALEPPQHRVKITRAFYLGVYEVTQSQFARVTGVNPSGFRESGPTAPVESLSWNEAEAFCRRLAELSRDKISAGEYRLPTEAEWEFACRAGTTTAYYFGDGESALPDYAWCGMNAGGKTHPVGEKKPNQFGLHDMLGNVYEMCSDFYSRDYYRQSPLSDPVGPPNSGMGRVARGGYCGASHPVGFRCAIRDATDPAGRNTAFGFRVVKSIPAAATTSKKIKWQADDAAVNLPDSAQRPSPSTADQPAEKSAESAAKNPKSRGEKSKPQPGTVLAEDKHEGWCGFEPRNNTYTLKTEAAEALGRTYIRFRTITQVRESNGRIFVSLDGDTFHPFAVWTTATCLESLKTAEGWQTVFFPPAVDKLRLKQIRIMFQHQSGPDGLTVYHVIWMKK